MKAPVRGKSALAPGPARSSAEPSSDSRPSLGNQALQNALGAGLRQDLPVCKGDGPTFWAADVDVKLLTNEELNLESLRVDAWLRAWGRSPDPDRPEYWMLAGDLRTERQKRVAAGHVWMATVEPATPARLMGLAGSGSRQQIILVDLAKALGRFEKPGMLVMTEAQFHAYLAARGIPITDEEGYLAWLQAQERGPLASFDPRAGLTAPEEPVLPFGATGRTTPWGEETIFDAPAGQIAAVGMATTRAYMSPADYFMSGPFADQSQTVSRRTGRLANIDTWIGNLAEESYRARPAAGFGLLIDPLNARGWTDYVGTRRQPAPILHGPQEHNHPTFDFSRRRGDWGAALLGVKRVQVKTSQQEQARRFAYYREGLAEMLDARGTPFQRYLRNEDGLSAVAKGTAAHPNPAYDAARSAILRDAYLAVNADDVVNFKAELRNVRDNWRFALYSDFYNAELREGPVTIRTASGTRSFATVAQINAATGLTAEEVRQVKTVVGERVANRVVSSGITTEQVRTMRTARNAVPPAMGPADIGAWSTPDYIGGLRAGPGLGGAARAAGGASVRGGGGGTLIALLTTSGMMIFDEADHPDWEMELAASGGMGMLGGGVSAGIEQPLIAAGGRYALSAGAARWVTPNLVKYGAGGVAAFGGSALVEGVSMGFFEERDHSNEEVASRGLRAGGMGAISYGAGTAASAGALAVIFGSAGSGAAGGSVVPGWGTAIGFVIGLGVGAVTYAFLDEVVPGSREDWEAEAEEKARAQAEFNAKVEAALAPYRRRLDAAEGLVEEGTPFAAGVDDASIPAGLGLRRSEREPAMSGPQ